MRIALGADHAGVALKADVKRLLDERGIAAEDFGTNSTDSVDYPDFAAKVARAGPIVDEVSAKLSREHNNANVLALGARVTTPDLARRIVNVFLDTPFNGG